jgi:predicted MPP superfamily phosphohydrolase
MHADIEAALERRLGRVHAQQRLAIEREHEAQAFGFGRRFVHIENLAASPALVRGLLMMTGLYRRGRANAKKLRVTHNVITSARLPPGFDGYTILQISDLHADMNRDVMQRLKELVKNLHYDVCVLTGDYRGQTFGPFDIAVEEMISLGETLSGPVYAVLGNHDTIAMVLELEEAGFRMLLNEHAVIERGGERIHLCGIDDAHFYRMDNIEKAAEGVPSNEFSILLTHTPEVYRHAAHAGFDVLLSGHTHGGQICLPGGIPLTLEADLPRRFGSGAWRYEGMTGYTSRGAGSSVVTVRFNCPPEITLHQLRAAT